MITENELKMYLGTKLKVQEYYDESAFILNAESFDYTIEYKCKPILYPLSMLTQPIWHEGKEVDVIEILLSTRDCDAEYDFIHALEDDWASADSKMEFAPMSIANKLAHYHFDINNLIGQGKAIAVTNEFNPYR